MARNADFGIVDGGDMAVRITIDIKTGDFGVGDSRLQPMEAKSEVEPKIGGLVNGSRNYGNAFDWLYLGGVEFGGQPATVGLCFHDRRLEQVSWNVELADAPMHDGWPTRGAIDKEVAFVRSILAQDGLHLDDSPKKFDWGEVWSSLDLKAFVASNGVRYRPL